MNIFVLCTGRCGSTTFAVACRNATNFTAGHETRIHIFGPERLAYPDNHIEVDNRLSWLLGRLDRQYGNRAAYVHLIRNEEDTAASFLRRKTGIIVAYREEIINTGLQENTMDLCLDYCRTVNANIQAFLQDKTKALIVRLEQAAEDFSRFWHKAGITGDLDAALLEFQTRHNAS